jgi:RHH-type proline utilization regulon transcriptional repressor/proline dehydrogenase/delta 1-pyrroline-5-carboxylate dehydrogenase
MTSPVTIHPLHDVQKSVERLLAGFRSDGAANSPPDVHYAIHLARVLCRRARELQTPQERRQQGELDRMINSPHDKATMMQLTDQAFRSQRAARSADQLVHILDVQGVPRFFSALDRTLLLGFQSFGSYLPGVAMPFVKERMQHETANVILPAERELLAEHLRARWEEGVRMNVNYLGEALLGEEDARRRLRGYLAALQQPEIEVISVKISTIYSQISALAREHTVGVLCDRLELLFRAAAKAKFERRDGTTVPKFVYLDMEEYRDKELTAEVFIRTLDRPGLAQARAGIALQAYIPDSYGTQQRINEWARKRVATGGSPVTIRLVKGANMEAERVEASLRSWPQAPYKTKLETDANYLRMLHEGLRPENIAAVQLGIASHNLFTLAYGLVLAAKAGVLDRVQFEMLEGMANHQRRALFELLRNSLPSAGRDQTSTGDRKSPERSAVVGREASGKGGETSGMLLYAPACKQEDFTNAVGYLVRRLDENTGPDNFLRHAFNIEVDSPEWQKLEQQFLAAYNAMKTVSAVPRRMQDRCKEREARSEERDVGVSPSHLASRSSLLIRNESDTDWSLPQNSEWAASIVASWLGRCDSSAADVPLVVAGEEFHDGRAIRESPDPSRFGVVAARYRQANDSDIDRAVAAARDDADGWPKRSIDERFATLQSVADQIAASRADLMGAMIADAGKTLAESDPEVSEAIDFCRFYAESAQFVHALSPVSAKGKGVVVVVSPWNFPLAIPCGGVAAALAAGNNVILKPASDTVLVAYLLCQCFWRAGVPKTALQFAPCSGGTVGQRLVSHDGVNAVILTGGTSTAAEMLRNKPTINLLAETGGKNATIVTALSDRDQAVKNVLHSAFSHSGQKCSATSLLILESEVYHDARFRAAFCDAVESLHVGSCWELSTKIGPLIRPPSGVLETGLKELEPGEEWAVMPRFHGDENPHLVSPGVKWGVQPGSFTHCTELFGPVLGVMEARDLDHAIELVNATGYGLTSGLESLDDREHEIWRQRIRAGNLYINRPTTGAIVLRQPFGGMGKSSVGPGIKAGGPNYVVPLMQFDSLTSATIERETRRAGEWEKDRSVVSPPLSPSLTLRNDTRWTENLQSLRESLEDGAAGGQPNADAETCRILAALASYLHWADVEFHAAHDHFRLLGEDNFRRYLPVEPLRIRVHADDALSDIFCRAAAARAAGSRATVSIPPDLDGPAADAVSLLDRLTDPWAGAIEFLDEDDNQLADAIRAGRVARVRYAAPERVPHVVRHAAAESLQYIADTPVAFHGRIELLWYLHEQSISHVYHRYGNLGIRSSEPRSEPD